MSVIICHVVWLYLIKHMWHYIIVHPNWYSYIKNTNETASFVVVFQNTRCRRVLSDIKRSAAPRVLYLIKHSYSCFKQYFKHSLIIHNLKPAAHERTCRAYLLFVTSWIDKISSCAGNDENAVNVARTRGNFVDQLVTNNKNARQVRSCAAGFIGKSCQP
jgi:hypothetical protein